MAYQQNYQQPYYNGGYIPPYQNGAILDTLNQYKGQYQVPTMPQPTQKTATNEMLWVLGEVEAQSFPVAPNNSVILWDKNNTVIYIKSANAQGIPSMRILDYTERTDDKAVDSTPKMPEKSDCKCKDRFVLKEDLEALKSEINGLKTELEELKAKPKQKSAKKANEVIEDGE